MPDKADTNTVTDPTRADALAQALCLLDTFAGEGLIHVYGNGQELAADTTILQLVRVFGVEADPGWYRKLAADLVASLPCKSGEGAGDRTLSIALDQNDAMRQELSHLGNLVTALENAMGVEHANADGSWPKLPGRVERLTIAAKSKTDATQTREAEGVDQLLDVLADRDNLILFNGTQADGYWEVRRGSLTGEIRGRGPTPKDALRAALNARGGA